MCAPVGCSSTYASTADAICNGPTITQDGACVTGDNTGSSACLSGGCAQANFHYQIYYTFTALTTAVIIDFTSTGILNADVAIITNGAGGCGDHVSVCPAVGSLCVESCATSVGAGALSINPTNLIVGETYTIMVESYHYEEFDGGVPCAGTLDSDAGGFQICITTDPCRNGIQDGAETGVDCGGTCGPCLATNDACVDDILLGLDVTNAIGSGASNTCNQTVCSDPNTEDCYIGPDLVPPFAACALYSYMSCGSVENNTWFTYTPPTTGIYNFALTNQVCAVGDGMQLWLGTLPSGCGDASTYNEIYCQSTATPADINYATTLTAGVTYYVTLDGFAGDDCSFDFGVYSSNPLPINLTYFDAKHVNGNVEIEWITESEKNNDYFTIERSIDNINYEVIEVVKGAGNSNTSKKYFEKDLNLSSGLYYYRLKQTDYDGKTNFVGESLVRISEVSDIVLAPNITNTDTKLKLFLSKATYTNIEVYDVNGGLVFNEKKELAKGNTSFSIPSSEFSVGTYFVKVDNGISLETLKLIKQ